MIRLCIALLLSLTVLPAGGQNAPAVRIDFSNPRLARAHWSLVVHPDGRGHFRAEAEVQPVSTTAAPALAKSLLAPEIDRDIHLSQAFADSVFQTARENNFFRLNCESHLKVAFEGWKKLSYESPESSGACEYNYSKDKQIQALGESLLYVANTILAGARLESLLQHDRLGLDKEMEFLTDAVDHGRALQICAIREILSRLASDDAVLDRVKKRARTLLAQADH